LFFYFFTLFNFLNKKVEKKRRGGRKGNFKTAELFKFHTILN